MYSRLFLLFAALLPRCSGESSVHGPPETVLALAGGAVILPCSFNNTASDEFPTVEWSKEGLEQNVIFLYRDGCEDHDMKNPAFRYRTSFITPELKNRNISLRIADVQLSDAGTYRCMRLWKNHARDITTVKLFVAAVSEPELTVVATESGLTLDKGVILQCEATCWLPEPEIQFLDDQGNNITADEPRRHQEASGCYNVTRRVTLQSHTNRVTCRVHQTAINQIRDKDIFRPAYCKGSSFLTIAIPIGVIILLLLACGLAFLLWKKCGKSVETQKLSVTRQSSDQCSWNGTYENLPLMPSQSPQAVMADNVDNSTPETLTREVVDLKSQLQKKEETIRQLQNNNKPQLSPIVCQFNQPTMVCSPAASTSIKPPKSGKLPQNQGPKPGISRQNPALGHLIQRNSSPAILNVAVSSSSSPVNTSKKQLGQIGRSMSDSSAWPGPKVLKLQRRHSLVLQSSNLSNNRFSVLANLKEESELLMLGETSTMQSLIS